MKKNCYTMKKDKVELLNLAEVASKAGVNRSYLSSMRSGKRKASEKIATKIVKTISPKLEIEDFFERKEN